MHQHEVVGYLTSIQTGVPQAHSDDEGEWNTAFFKKPIDGAISVSSLGIAGDGVADTEHHGGVDKAVLAYSVDHYFEWSQTLGHDLPYGAFGENLSVRGIDEAKVCIGDQWQVGDVVFQVSQPRQPCWKLGRRWRHKVLPKLVVQNGRSGWYFRVLHEGQIEAKAAISLASRPQPAWPIIRANEVFYRGTDHERLELARVAELSESWRSELSP